MPTLHPKRKSPPLSGRLFAIAEALPETGTVADIGSDHGYLPCHLLQKDPERRVIVTDVNPLPLARARERIASLGFVDRARFLLTDGLSGVDPAGIAAFVIAGLSGETIASILEAGKATLRPGQIFLLQPMTHEEILRAHLFRAGYQIRAEKAVRENGKVFLILSALFTGEKGEEPDPVVCAVGRFLPLHLDENARAYYRRMRDRLEGVAEGRRKAGLSTSEQDKILNRIAAIMEE
ncbi:MAG: SAM-dependent methyltransferase [Clostridia bacterium]|nr:SAM-dependent methyltransferase [Clostridia bacterium]